MKIHPFLVTVARFAAAIILLQTLYFKFSGSAESVYIFSTIGMEPWGRWAVGFMELVAGGFLISRSWNWLGALLGIGLMVGAIGMHLTLLGISVMDDGGYLFFLAVVVAVLCGLVFTTNRHQIPAAIRKFLPAFLQ
ncbi:MAG: DoxX family protein [Cyclobacteriaceae bacterium]|nr:DoxX family protein [Cyclobacteriaceae bacterium]